MKLLFWKFANYYAKIFGWKFFVPFHHMIINLSLHSLGYGNALSSEFSGEKIFIKRYLSKIKPKLVIDVGANVGNYSRLVLDYVDTKIYALEPNPNCFLRLQELPDTVTKLNVALADFEGKATLHSRNDLDEKATLESKFEGGEETEVEVRRMDCLAKELGIKEVDFVKIDTEGYEKEVILGFGEVKPKIIQFEFNIHHLYKNQTLSDLVKLLSGYKFFRLIPNGLIEINPDKFLDNIFMFSNILAVRDDIVSNFRK